MKCKKITTFLGLFSLCVAASAQNDGLSSQLQGGFNQVWKADSVGNGAIPGNYLRPGTQPQGWEASNVHQKVLIAVQQELVFADTDRTGSEGFSVKMVNTSVGAMGITSPAPAYITWGGTPWVYAVADLKSCDGGTVGGRSFTFRPDSIVGYYKRTLEGESKEPAKIILYSWKGSFTSEVKTNPKGSLTSNSTAQVVDQDLAVLGKITEGVTKSENAELIATCEYDLTEAMSDWTRVSVPVTYHSDNAPEKMAVILSSSNYWTRSDIHSGNTLWADDVMLVYNSSLASLTIGGEALAGFSKDVYAYEVEGDAPALDQVVAVADGVGATVETSLEGNVLTIVVKGNDYAVNPENVHTYQITYVQPADPVYAEYQLPNADFEANWTLNQYESAMGAGISYSEETPDFWNSFYRADGDYADAALKLFSNQAGSVKQTAGYDGTGSAALIFSRKNMMNTISNGNLTSGIVHMGSMTADDPQNYNYSDLDNPTGRCEFVGLPDSVSVYFLFQPVDASLGNASMNMILHSEYEYKDPSAAMGAEDSLKYLVARASASVEAAENWTCYTVPFQYNGDNYQAEGKRYMLTSFSTNAKAGKGSDGDSLSIDHIRLIYNSRLSSLTIGGEALAGFSKDVYTYEVATDAPELEQIKAVADGIGATVETVLEDKVLTITVKGNDYTANPENVHTYQIIFTGKPDGISQTGNPEVSVVYADGQLLVSHSDGTVVEVYTMQGILLARFVADGTPRPIDLPRHSIYVVKAGAYTTRILSE